MNVIKRHSRSVAVYGIVLVFMISGLAIGLQVSNVWGIIGQIIGIIVGMALSRCVNEWFIRREIREKVMDKLTVKLEGLREELTTGHTAREQDYGKRLALADACLIGVLQHLVSDSRTPREQRTVYMAIIDQYEHIREPGFKYSYE